MQQKRRHAYYIKFKIFHTVECNSTKITRQINSQFAKNKFKQFPQIKYIKGHEAYENSA